MRISGAVICFLAGLGLVVLLLPALSLGATAGETVNVAIAVNTTADELADNGNCSLREAIQAVNTSAPVDACSVGDQATIELPSGIYSLSLAGSGEDNNYNGDLDIRVDVTIQGAGASLSVIDGRQLDRVIQVHAGAAVTISAVSVRNGQAPDGSGGNVGGDGWDGGGIYNAGTLTLSNCDLNGNRAGQGGSVPDIWTGGDGGHGGRGGGLFNLGALHLERCIVRDNSSGDGGVGGVESNWAAHGGHGGGIFNLGTMTIKESSIFGNHTGTGGSLVSPPGILCGDGGDGGGIYNAGTLTLESSTLNVNQTGPGNPCGGSHSIGGDGGRGGGIYNANTLALSNSTISDNLTGAGSEGGPGSASGKGGDGGGIYNAGALALDNGTIAANQTGASPSQAGAGGGLANIGDAQVRNTILAGNQSAFQGPDCSGSLTSAGYNLFQTVTGCTLTGETTADIVDRPALLRPLADYGGPTWTQALTPGSPALEAGSCTRLGGGAVTTDQRSITRPVGLACDIGAYEAPIFQKDFLPAISRPPW